MISIAAAREFRTSKIASLQGAIGRERSAIVTRKGLLPQALHRVTLSTACLPPPPFQPAYILLSAEPEFVPNSSHGAVIDGAL